jgi:myo-inositol-1(or 4)-monophosphatase
MKMAAIAMKGGEIARSSLRRYDAGEMVHKKPRDFQTEADVAVETFIVGALDAGFPEYGIEGEEKIGNRKGMAGRGRFHIDPIDGTTNYAWGIPHFGVVLTLEEEGVLPRASSTIRCRTNSLAPKSAEAPGSTAGAWWRAGLPIPSMP